MMRAVFLGFETVILEALSSCCEVVGVYVATPRSAFRALRDWPLRYYRVRAGIRSLAVRYPLRLQAWHRRLMPYHIADYAQAHGLPQLMASSVNHRRFIDALSKLKPDIGIVANFGQFLGDSLLKIPRHGFINFHPSLLPQYRGPNPLPRMLLHGDKRGGVTWHRVCAAIDGGDILAQQSYDISEFDTVHDLTRRATDTAAGMLPLLVSAIESGTCRAVPQDERKASYHPKLSPEEKQRLMGLEQGRRLRRRENLSVE